MNQYWTGTVGDEDFTATLYDSSSSAEDLDCVDEEKDEQEYTAECENGIAIVNLWIQQPRITTITTTPECAPITEEKWEKIKVTFSLICQPLCTEEPTVSPTEPPTSSPTETLCVDIFPDPVVEMDPPDIPGRSPPLKILRGDGNTVTFEVHEFWSDLEDETSPFIASHYDHGTASNKLDCVDVDDSEWDDVTEHTVECVGEVATVNLWLQEEVTTISTDNIPDKCAPITTKEWVSKKYTYKLNCRSICVPIDSQNNAGGACVQEADLQENQTEGDVTFSRNPIDIFEQHGSTVKFSIAQFWRQNDDLTWVMAKFTDLSGVEQCPKTLSLTSGASTSTYTAKCTNQIATVTVYAKDDSFPSTSVVPELSNSLVCDPGLDQGHQVKYVFEIPCDSADTNFCIENTTPAARREEVVPEDELSGEQESGYYCLSEDFPCEGGNGMVHVCHYSSRKGYQTFCIPEADSEVLRFYSHDYCGPCVGGYGGIQSE